MDQHSTSQRPPVRRKVLALTITESCNLDCVYCYEPSKHQRSMSFETATSAIERHLNDESFDEVEISFHGGEPFLEFDLIKTICEWTWERQWKLPYIFFVTTNGTLVKGSMRNWLEEHKERFYCCLSLDGTREMHNINRSNSFDKIDSLFFKQTWPDQPAKMTISKLTLPMLADGIIFMHTQGIEFRCNVACFSDWEEAPSLLNTFTKQLSKLVSWYLDHPEQKICNLLSLPLHTLGYDILHPNEPNDDNSNWCGFGKNMVAIGINGNEYPCHVLVPFGEMNGEKKDCKMTEYEYIQNTKSQRYIDTRCTNCILTNICPTCYAANYQMRGALELRDQTECSLFKIRSRASAYLYGQMLAANKDYVELKDCDTSRKKLIAKAVLAIDNYSAVEAFIL